MAPREQINKHAYFQLKQALAGLSDDQKAKELKDGSEDDIYWWCSGIPDKVAPKITDDAERIVREMGFFKIGYCKDLPESRRRK